MHSCPEAESRESPREREREIQGQEKREREEAEDARGIKDDASCSRAGLGLTSHPRQSSGSDQVMNQPLD